MHKRDEILGILKAALPYLKSEYGVKSLALFGSVARGGGSESSDVDLLVDFERPVGLRFMALADRLEDLLGAKVDLLTPTGLDSIRRPAIAKSIRESVIHV